MRKRSLLLVLAIVLVASVAWAGGEQKGQAGPMNAAERAAKLQERLELTDAQTAKVRAVYEAFDPRLQALRARAEKGEDIKADKTKLMEERDAKLKAILTAEQWKRYQEMRSQYPKPKQ